MAPEPHFVGQAEGAIPSCLPLRKEDLQAYLLSVIGNDMEMKEFLSSSVPVWRQVWDMAFDHKATSMLWDEAGQTKLAYVEELLDKTFLAWQNHAAANPTVDLAEAGRPWYWRTSGPCGNEHCPRVVDKVSITCIPECRFYY